MTTVRDFASLPIGGSEMSSGSPRVIAAVSNWADGDLDLMQTLFAQLTPPQRRGRARLPRLWLADASAYGDPLELTAAERRVLLLAALSSSDSTHLLLSAAAVETDVIVNGVVGEYLRFDRGAYAFRAGRTRDLILADTTPALQRDAHRALSRAHHNFAMPYHSAWHGALGGAEPTARGEVTLTRWAEALLAAGNMNAAFDVAALCARRSTGPQRDRFLLVAAQAALWAGLLDEAASQLTALSKGGSSSAAAQALAHAIDSFSHGITPGADVRQDALDALLPLLPTIGADADRRLLEDFHASIAKALKGDLAGSDAAAARLRLSMTPSPPPWPLRIGHPAPSPLAEAHLKAITGAFELSAGLLDASWRTLMDSAERLPVELVARGIVASLLHLIEQQDGRGTWVVQAIEALAPSPPLRYHLEIPATSALSAAASRELSPTHPDPIGALAPLGLTPREVEVTLLVRRGLGNRAIADELGISARTVEVHLSRVYRKLGVPTRSMLIARSAATPDPVR